MHIDSTGGIDLMSELLDALHRSAEPERGRGPRHGLDEVALNPQPLPPKEGPAWLGSVLDTVALNPQPLPPKEQPTSFGTGIDAVALNPQPLPPRWLDAVHAAVSLHLR